MSTIQTNDNANPVLVEVTRGDIVEIRHRGSIAIADSNGQLIYGLGDMDSPVYPRSALKYVQVLPLLYSGAADHFGFTDKEIAIMAASHTAEDVHVETVRGIWEKTGLGEENLRCGSHYPNNAKAKNALIRASLKPNQIHNNCSGKHSGFLALAKFLGASMDNYLELDHPVQVMIREALEMLVGISSDDLVVGIDGCSAPNYAMPLPNMAQVFAAIDAAETSDAKLNDACRRLVTAVTSNPMMVSGTGRFCTDLMSTVGDRVFGKLGAAGYYSIGIRGKKIGVAVKTESGVRGPQFAPILAVLKKMEVISESEFDTLKTYFQHPVLNRKDKVTGEFRLAAGVEIPDIRAKI